MATHGRQATENSHALLLSAFGAHPFRRSDALALGLTLGQFRAVCARQLVCRLSRDVYVAQVEPTTDVNEPTGLQAVRAATARLSGLRFVVAGRAAATLRNLPFVRPPGRGDGRQGVEVLLHRDDVGRCGRRKDGAIIRPVPRLPQDAESLFDIPVTSVAHTAIDLVRMGTRPCTRLRAQALPLPESLVPLDAATRRLGAETPQQARELIAAYRPRFRHAPGIRSVDSALEFIDPRSESPLESWARGYMLALGVPTPQLQHLLTGADGRTYRVDFCWPEARVIVEVDGLAKYGDTPIEVRANKRREIERQRALEAAGWIVIRWTWDDLARDPWALMRHLNRLVTRAA